MTDNEIVLIQLFSICLGIYTMIQMKLWDELIPVAAFGYISSILIGHHNMLSYAVAIGTISGLFNLYQVERIALVRNNLIALGVAIIVAPQREWAHFVSFPALVVTVFATKLILRRYIMKRYWLRELRQQNSIIGLLVGGSK
jgi:hypothetical protein